MKNITLVLPEGYEVIASIKLHCVYGYYEIVQTALWFYVDFVCPFEGCKRAF